ncbi:unnamed protein product [Nyctereutes procyonoides]|uniref:(raccoon dog) hypothetical protein n=1 Tax=Nyctereutes procyonoides TaxID=34880 RepID=A0A811Y5N3_NYCPR|nr:unnamed protein product [Nyctereutes procyonoides]
MELASPSACVSASLSLSLSLSLAPLSARHPFTPTPRPPPLPPPLCPDFYFCIHILSKGNQGSLKKWLIPDLGPWDHDLCQRQPLNPLSHPVGEWINKWWYIQTTEYYSALKRNELSSHEKTWKKLINTELEQIKVSTKGIQLRKQLS